MASTLEAEWNAALRKLQETQQNEDQRRQKYRLLVDESVRAEILALSTDFPAVWNNPNTTDQDRKRLVRLLIEDVTLTRSEDGIIAQVRFRGGKTQWISLSAPRKSYQIWITPPEVVQAIDQLLYEHTDQETTDILNERGFHTGKGGSFTKITIGNLRRSYQLKSYYERLRAVGMLTTQEMAQTLGVSGDTVKKWRDAGLLPGRFCNEKGDFLYEPPGNRCTEKTYPQTLVSKNRVTQE